MIRDIKELKPGFPDYATLEQATVTVQDMGEKTISSQVQVDGDIVPDFSADWEVEFRGEKYIMPLREPQAGKKNTSLYSTIDLTFQHWAVYQLKRWYFFTVPPVESGTAVPDQYVASVRLNLEDFCNILSQVLLYYYGTSITLSLNPGNYKKDPVAVEISNSYVWDVLIKLYDLYAVHWAIEPRADNDNTKDGGERYVIRVGYPSNEIGHIFRYGFEGGLLSVERQVQDDNIRNMILGRGGQKNLPRRYFKEGTDDGWSEDPDWIPELRNIYFSELRGATFRSYIQGWKTKHYSGASVTEAEKAYAPWAWWRGYNDTKFNPVEYVADRFEDVRYGYNVDPASSIAKYGELMGGLPANEDIHPTIQGVELDGIGRADEAVSVEQVQSDEVEEATKSDAKIVDVGSARLTATVDANGQATVEAAGGTFNIPEGMHGNLDEGEKVIELTKGEEKISVRRENGTWTVSKTTIDIDVENLGNVIIEDAIVTVYGFDGTAHSASGIPAGDYYFIVTLTVRNNTNEKLKAEVTCEHVRLTYATLTDNKWTGTFDVWVKNIWGTEKFTTESNEAYAERVWRPILGDRDGGEAKVVFADGRLSTSEDYEFTIVKGGVAYDQSKSIQIRDELGNVTGTVKSEWRLTLEKSDADLESTGLYVPSTRRQGKAGDHFFFTGIDMPHQYVVWAEERLDNWKKDELAKVCRIRPAWVVKTDRVRICGEGSPDALIWQLQAGSTLRLADKRFIDTEYDTLYLQSVTYTYRQPSSDDAAINPDVEIVLTGQYETMASPMETLRSEVSAIASQIGSLSNIVQLIRAVGDRVYLRKDGIADRSVSPTEFASLITSDEFIKGVVGGAGWGFFKDETGAWVLETDKISIREELYANTMVINQIEVRGGTIVESAANMKITRVVEIEDGYKCYFDQRGGTIANLFHVGDVARCNRFTPENGNLKYYSRRVMEVTQTSVKLTKGYAPVEMPDGTVDTGVDGSGVPEEGDVIVHFGSYTDPERRFVKVRDVVGGGYERYIEGLDRAGANGTEYYFVGRQSGMYGGRPRFFIGSDEEFVEWKEGKLNVTGQVHVSKGSTGAGNFTDLPAEVAKAVSIGGENLLRNTGFDGEFNSLDMEKAGTLTASTNMYGNPLEYWTGSGKVVEEPEAVSGFACELTGGLSISQDVSLIPGETYMLSLMAVGVIYIKYGDQSQFSVPLTEDTAATRREVRLENVTGGRTTFTFIGDDKDTATRLFDLKLERGTVATDWCPAREDTDPVADRFRAYDYLRQALVDGGTDILNGVILTSIINLGNPKGGSVTDVTAGASGIRSTDEDIAFWAGGTLADAIRTRSRVRAGGDITETEWQQMIGFCVTHGGDAFFKGWVNALGGTFRNITTPNRGFVVDNDGNVSMNNASINMKYFVGEEHVATMQLSSSETPLRVVNEYDGTTSLDFSFGQYAAGGFYPMIRMANQGERNLNDYEIVFSTDGIVCYQYIPGLTTTRFGIKEGEISTNRVIDNRIKSSFHVNCGIDGKVHIKVSDLPTFDEAAEGEVYLNTSDGTLRYKPITK